jgi:hypothetical protein
VSGATASTSASGLCMTLGPKTQATVAWPADTSQVFSLANGARYELTYNLTVTGGASNTLTTEILHAGSAFVDYSFQEAAGSVVHIFTATGYEPSPLFELMPANTPSTGNITVCYDNVSFVQLFAP